MSAILLPRLSETMEEGVIVAWLVDDGVAVERGEPIVEIETDKASVVYEAEAGGVVQILAEPGETIAVGAPIARLVEAESPDAVEPSPSRGTRGSVERHRAAETGSRSMRPVRATPVARRAAREHGVDLSEVEGSGRDGRICREDVERVLAASRDAPSLPAAASGSAPPADGRASEGSARAGAAPVRGTTTHVSMTRVQQTIARRMAAAATIPVFTVGVDADIEDMLTLRDQLKVGVSVAPSVNDFVVKAVALALKEHPHVNGCFSDGASERYSRVNVGFAVAVEGSLLVPTIFDADFKPLVEIARESRELAARAREHTIAPASLAGGTFTVSNLGMFGASRVVPIVSVGQAAILGVGAAQGRCVPGPSGAFTVRRFCELTLVSDHRILYGADATRFATRIAELLATPLVLLAT